MKVITKPSALIFSGLVVFCVVFFNRRGSQPVQFDGRWTSPIAVTETQFGLANGMVMYKCLDTAVAFDASLKCFVMRNGSTNGSNVWMETTSIDADRRFLFLPTAGQSDGRILFPRHYTTNDQLEVRILLARLTRDLELQVETDKAFYMNKEAILGTAKTNVSLNNPYIGIGSMHNADIYLPYSVYGTTLTTHTEVCPFANGVFHSIDSGMTWLNERISTNFEGLDPSACASEEYCYYFTRGILSGYTLGFSRKRTHSNSWDAPKPLSKTIAGGGGWSLCCSGRGRYGSCLLDG